jgi:hypothetical protein
MTKAKQAKKTFYRIETVHGWGVCGINVFSSRAEFIAYQKIVSPFGYLLVTEHEFPKNYAYTRIRSRRSVLALEGGEQVGRALIRRMR